MRHTFPGSDPKPAKRFPGSTPRPRFTAAVYRTAIAEKLDAGLSVQRIWQDLGFASLERTIQTAVADVQGDVALSEDRVVGTAPTQGSTSSERSWSSI
jgi:hypothetical protein